VQPETRLYTAADLSTEWVYAAVSQTDMARVKVGEPATLTTDAYPSRVVNARVNFMWQPVDLTTSTQRVRLVFLNAGVSMNAATRRGRCRCHERAFDAGQRRVQHGSVAAPQG